MFFFSCAYAYVAEIPSENNIRKTSVFVLLMLVLMFMLMLLLSLLALCLCSCASENQPELIVPQGLN